MIGKSYRTPVYMCSISQLPGAGTHPWLSESSSPLLDPKGVESMIKQSQKPSEISPKLEAKPPSAASEGTAAFRLPSSFSLDTYMDKESICHIGIQERR